MKLLIVSFFLSVTSLAAQNPIHGTPGEDDITGTPGADNIYGYEGGDEIYAGGGSDYVAGGDGQDEAHGEDGNDILDGGEGRDFVYGDDGGDEVAGGNGPDELDGGPGVDTFFDGPLGINNTSDCDVDKIIANDGENEHIYCGANDTIKADPYDYIIVRQKGTGIIIDQGYWHEIRERRPELIYVNPPVFMELAQEIVDIVVALYGITEGEAINLLILALEYNTIVEIWYYVIHLGE